MLLLRRCQRLNLRPLVRLCSAELIHKVSFYVNTKTSKLSFCFFLLMDELGWFHRKAATQL